MKPQLVLLGAPGSGKGTQANKLTSELGYKHLSTGDLLRSEISKGSDLGKKVSEILERGALVDDGTVIELLKANSNMNDGHHIFDGFPRTLPQAETLSNEILSDSSNGYFAIYFELDLDLLKDRLVNRRTCKDCGEIYNLLYKAPDKEGVCNKCSGTNLEQRKDDTEETVQKRLGVFKEQIDPLLTFYENKGCLKRIDASLAPEIVFEKLQELL